MKKIKEKHKKNNELIKKFKIEVGDKIKLKKDYRHNTYLLNKNSIFTISSIHSLFGWIGFKETEQLPQEVLKIFNLIDIKEFNKMKIIKNLN